MLFNRIDLLTPSTYKKESGCDGKITALESQETPYRPEEQAEVEAMSLRASQAEKNADPWVPIRPPKEGEPARTFISRWELVWMEKPL